MNTILFQNSVEKIDDEIMPFFKFDFFRSFE